MRASWASRDGGSVHSHYAQNGRIARAERDAPDTPPYPATRVATVAP